MPRLNPRQRYNEDRTCTTAGVSIDFWTTLIELAWVNIGTPFVRSSQEEVLRYAASDADYKHGLEIFATQLAAGVKAVRAGVDGWVEYPLLKVRRGRGDEVTVVSKSGGGAGGAAIGAFLTNASLGWHARHPCGNTNPAFGPLNEQIEPTAYMVKIEKIIKMLEKSADRRPDYTYRDKPISELRANYDHAFTLGRRREAIVGSIAQKKRMDAFFESKGWGGPNLGRLARLDRKVAKALEEKAAA